LNSSRLAGVLLALKFHVIEGLRNIIQVRSGRGSRA
jgi:hypothetical protein